MKIEIRSWMTGKVLWLGEAMHLRGGMEIAVKSSADLEGAHLQGADLRGANSLVLPTGETLEEYRKQIVPALLTAGGKSLAAVLATGCWDCHESKNSPIAEAFGVHSIEEVPILYRPRAQQFVQLFYAGWLPKPVLEPS